MRLPTSLYYYFALLLLRSITTTLSAITVFVFMLRLLQI
jgi:hypothetical protein